MLKRILCALAALAILLQLSCAGAMTRDELRAAYARLVSSRSDASPYTEVPDLRKYSPGEVSQEKLADALNYLNFIREIAGLEAVALSPLYNLRSQNAALLLAANDAITHSPSQPEDMPDELYESAWLGASLGNLACFNWMHGDILIDAVEYFVRDDGDMNLYDQGHRRWLLNPRMAETGFGLASAASGNSYIAMFAVDDGNSDVQWDYVAWPAGGCFPVELMRSSLAWSVSLNDAVYDMDASAPSVTLRERTSGAAFHFQANSSSGDGFCSLNRENCGAGDCLIFRPELERQGLTEYLQNQVWDVEICGLVLRDGGEAALSYSCEMVSLYPQDAVNVELSQIEAALSVGEQLKLEADVIPVYADDLRVDWASSDENVATVDFFGNVTAMGPGSCEITAMSHNGRSDACKIIVK